MSRADERNFISSDEKLNQEFRVDPEDLMRVDPEDPKPVRQREKGRRSRGFARFLVAICLGIAGTLAWQSYGEVTKQIIATRAPELGWSPGAKQMIASSIEWLGWTKPPSPQKTLREMVQQLTAAQDQTAREVAKLESAVTEILMKMPETPQPAAAPARKPAPVPQPPLPH